MAYTDNIFTIYHLMEKAKVFSQNPANIGAQDSRTRESLYKGPVEYPKMLYSPKGEYRITVPAEIISTPFGPQRVGEQRELINKIVESKEEEAVLRHLGWLTHPAKSIHAGGGEAPPMSSGEQIKTLEEQIAQLTRQLQEAEDNRAPDAPMDDSKKADHALSGAKTIKVA